MQSIDLSKPGEKKKLLAAAFLGVVAIIFLWWTLFGFGGSTGTPQRVSTSPSPSPGIRPVKPNEPGRLTNLTEELREVSFVNNKPDLREGGRNIFAYWEPPPKPSPGVNPPTPTPTPTPPLLLATVSPSNVYARTADFTLDVTGDKFEPSFKIYFDGRDLPTRYQSPQQLSTTVPSTLIANPGSHQISVQSSDAALYSNQLTLNVAEPPVPNYSYIGMYSTTRHVDTAMLQDKSDKQVKSFQRGDIVGGRFRVTSISEKELVLVDTSLKIKHTLTMSEAERGPGSPLTRPTPKVDAEDDEP